MARCENIRAGVVVQTIVLWLLSAGPSAAADAMPVHQSRPGEVDLFLQFDKYTAPLLTGADRFARRPRHWLHLEVEAARAQAQDWLRESGFSLLEERDGDGRRSYQVISSTPADEWPAMRVHARVGLPELSAGLRACT